MTTKEMIEVMQAYERGEQIEWRKSKECKWEDVIHPTWDWSRITYRIKPKPTYRPYKNAEEFLEAQKEHGIYIRHKKNIDCYILPLYVCDDHTVCNDGTSMFGELLQDYKWQDGTPCGKEE